MPFSVFITSTELLISLGARGFDVPKSATTIRNMVVLFSKNKHMYVLICKQVVADLQKIRSNGIRFSTLNLISGHRLEIEDI